MTQNTLTLKVMPFEYGICKLSPSSAIPAWANEGRFISITKTDDELSIVCECAQVPEDICCEKPFKMFKIEGVLDFSLVGILAKISTLLADQGISIFALSTYNTDYILVKTERFALACDALSASDYRIRP